MEQNANSFLQTNDGQCQLAALDNSFIDEQISNKVMVSTDITPGIDRTDEN